MWTKISRQWCHLKRREKLVLATIFTLIWASTMSKWKSCSILLKQESKSKKNGVIQPSDTKNSKAKIEDQCIVMDEFPLWFPLGSRIRLFSLYYWVVLINQSSNQLIQWINFCSDISTKRFHRPKLFSFMSVYLGERLTSSRLTYLIDHFFLLCRCFTPKPPFSPSFSRYPAGLSCPPSPLVQPYTFLAVIDPNFLGVVIVILPLLFWAI